MVNNAAQPVKNERELAEQLQRERIKAIMENKNKILNAVEEGFGEALTDELEEKMERGGIKVDVTRIPRSPHYDSPAGSRKKLQPAPRRKPPLRLEDEIKSAPPPKTAAPDQPRLVPPGTPSEEPSPEEATLPGDAEEAPPEAITDELTPATAPQSNSTTKPASIPEEGQIPLGAETPRQARPAEKPPAAPAANAQASDQMKGGKPAGDQPDQANVETDKKTQAVPPTTDQVTAASKTNKPAQAQTKEQQQAVDLKKEKQQTVKGEDRPEEAVQPPAPAEEEKEEERTPDRSGLTQGINALRYRREIKAIDTQVKQLQKQRLPQARAIAQVQKKIRPLLAAYNATRLALLILRLIKIPLDLIGLILLVFGVGALLLTIDRILGVAVRALKKTKMKLARLIIPYRKQIKKARLAIADLDIKIMQLSRQRRMLVNTSLLERRQAQPATT